MESQVAALEQLPELGQTVLGSFRLERQLGAGSCAVAYLAEQIGTERKAVVKFPHPHLIAGAHGAEMRRRFQLEARAATRVSHPHLVTTYMVGETSRGIPAIAMEYVRGQPMSQYLRARAPVSTEQLALLGEQIGEALMVLHSAGIVHRDLSPSNVMVTAGSRGMAVKVLDFGVAKLLDTPSRTLGPLGTPGYLAPEQLAGQVSPRSDVYSLGALLWWALTGQERADDFHDGSLLLSLGATKGPDPMAANPSAPPALASIVSRMLVPSQQHRLTIDEFLHQWRAALDRPRSPHRSIAPGSSLNPQPLVEKTVAVVASTPGAHSLIASRMQTLPGVTFEAVGARDLTRANPDTFDAVVIEADLPTTDVPATLRLLSELYPELPCAVVGGPSQSAYPWEIAGARGFVDLGGDLSGLRDILSRELDIAPTSSIPLDVRAKLRSLGTLEDRVQDVIGGMPHWTATLDKALRAQDLATASAMCQRIQTGAETLGLMRITQLSRAGCAFLADGDFESAAAFVEPIRQRFSEIFPELLTLITHQQKVNR